MYEGVPYIFIVIFLCMVLVLSCLRMSQVQDETCDIHVREIQLIKINLCCIRVNKCGFILKLDTCNILNCVCTLCLSLLLGCALKGSPEGGGGMVSSSIAGGI